VHRLHLKDRLILGSRFVRPSDILASGGLACELLLAVTLTKLGHDISTFGPNVPFDDCAGFACVVECLERFGVVHVSIIHQYTPIIKGYGEEIQENLLKPPRGLKPPNRLITNQALYQGKANYLILLPFPDLQVLAGKFPFFRFESRGEPIFIRFATAGSYDFFAIIKPFYIRY